VLEKKRGAGGRESKRKGRTLPILISSSYVFYTLGRRNEKEKGVRGGKVVAGRTFLGLIHFGPDS